MRVIGTVGELRAALAGRDRVGLVATMGNLHDGHAALAHAARSECGTLVASIFVNRLQFGAGEDFATYPRTFEADCGILEKEGVDFLFAPTERELYPEPQVYFVDPPAIANELCGAFRPGHFRGVATVVLKLFNIVRPDAAWFGKKDYQQWMIIRRMVQQFALPVRIVGIDTVRAPDGVALSSRNGYLDAAQRAEAAQLFRCLTGIRDAALAGSEDFAGLCAAAADTLARRGWTPEYFEVRRQSDLAPAVAADRELVALAAAKLGPARLIDNLEWVRPSR